jgi:hypothetical protein
MPFWKAKHVRPSADGDPYAAARNAYRRLSSAHWETPQSGANPGTEEAAEGNTGPELAGVQTVEEASPALGYKVVHFPIGRHWPYTQDEWRELSLVAECKQATWTLASLHSAPNPNCTCGIYAAHLLADALRYGTDNPCLVLVQGWGRVIEHETGWRAQYAKIVGFITDASDWGFPADTSLHEAEARIAIRYGREPDTFLNCGLNRLEWLAPALRSIMPDRRWAVGPSARG